MMSALDPRAKHERLAHVPHPLLTSRPRLDLYPAADASIRGSRGRSGGDQQATHGLGQARAAVTYADLSQLDRLRGCNLDTGSAWTWPARA